MVHLCDTLIHYYSKVMGDYLRGVVCLADTEKIRVVFRNYGSWLAGKCAA